MIIYFSGTEIPSWRKLLNEQGVHNISLSYMGLRRRTKFVRPWRISEKYGVDDRIFLDSGAYTINSDDQKFSTDELLSIYAHYQSFVMDNIDSVAMVSEFDALSLGKDWLKTQREDFWADIPESKFLPIWHPETGLEELDALCSNYLRVGIPKTALGDLSLIPTLNGYVKSHGTKLHGIAMTKPEEMRDIRWDSVASTSWISPSQWGDTIIWVNNQLKRYPKKYKDVARKRHRTLFEQNGFDAEKIEADDATELLRLSVWSWRKVEEHINSHKVATTPSFSDSEENAENPSTVVDTPGSETRNNLPTIRTERQVIPTLKLQFKEDKYTDDSGEEHTTQTPIIHSRSESMRICNTCFLKTKCPAFQPDSNCVYDIPITIRTNEQMKAAFNAIIEQQYQRVLFMQMAEDMEGGYIDVNLSNEMDRLSRLIKQKHEMEAEGWSFQIQAKGSGPGLVEKLLGQEAHQRANALPTPIPADQAIPQVIDVEVIDDIPDRE